MACDVIRGILETQRFGIWIAAMHIVRTTLSAHRLHYPASGHFVCCYSLLCRQFLVQLEFMPRQNSSRLLNDLLRIPTP